jgi:hypothetical protein
MKHSYLLALVVLLALNSFLIGEEAKSQGGSLTGVITAKGDVWIEVRSPEGKDAQRFLPRWIGRMPADGGHLEESILKKIRELKVGDKVELKWMFEEHNRVLEIKKIGSSENAFGGEKKSEGGTMTGIVKAVGDNWIDVKAPDAEDAKHFIPRWIGGMPAKGGHLEESILKKIRELKVGDKVELKWMFEEHNRVLEIKKIGSSEESEKAKKTEKK